MNPRILYIQYTNPGAYPPLQHSSRILADAGWEVSFLGIESHGGSRDLIFPPHKNITVRRLPYQAGGWKQKVHYAHYALWAVSWALRQRPAWVYASDPLSCPIALAPSYLPGVELIYHEHDSPNPSFSPSGAMRLVHKARRAVAQRARRCILPNERRAELFAQQTGGTADVATVWNCSERSEVVSEEHEPQEKETFRLLYLGSIVPDRIPLAVVEALARLPDRVRLRLIGYETFGHEGYVDALYEKARQFGIEDRIEYLGPLPREQALQQSDRCDVGLMLMPLHSDQVNMQWMVGASNKAFDYLARRMALLVSDLPEWRSTYVDAGYGLVCDPENPESIEEAVRRLLEDPVELHAMQESGRKRILDEWNYERQFQPIFELINEKGQPA